MNHTKAPVAKLLLLLMSVGCSASSDGVEPSAERQPLGKADAIGSCAGPDGDFCGGKSEGNCWCDEQCEVFGDCCSDHQDVCEAGGSTTGAGQQTCSMGETGTASGGDAGSSTSDTGSMPEPCGDDAYPVHVEGGGGYSTIQAGIDAAPAGQTVTVCPGTYTESLTITRSLRLIAAGSEVVTLDADGADIAIELDLPGGSEVEIEGLSIGGANTGVSAEIQSFSGALLAMRDVTISDMESRGLMAFGGSTDIEDYQVELDHVRVTGIANSDVDGAGLYLLRVTATLIDCVIEDNATTASGGGLYVVNSLVTMHGGRVRRNFAAERGGGAALDSYHGDATPPKLVLVDSDWGAGQALENEAEDVSCSGEAVTWLGQNVNVTCNSSVSGCCVAN